MKIFAPLIFLISCLLFPTATQTIAQADEFQYAVAPDSNVWFYSSEREEDKLFLLPETYYVRILSTGETYSAVEYLVNEPPYKKIMGYCRTDAIQPVPFTPERPYLKKQITAKYTIPDSGGGISGPMLGTIEKMFVYYGLRYENGQLYYYVLDGETFGYIPAQSAPDFERNDDWLNYKPTPPDDGEVKGKSGSSAVQIVIVCVVGACAVAVAVLLLRGKKPIPPDDHGEF